MAQYITKIRTESGDLQIDYEALANKPVTNNLTPTYTVASNDADLTSGEKLSTAFGKIAKAIKTLRWHKDAIKKAVHRNLLDNSDFRNPVNQRGQKTYAYVDKYVRTIDRWAIYSDGAVVTVEDGYISKVKTLGQNIAGLDKSKIYTAVVCSKDGVVSSYSGTITDGIGSWYDNVYVYSGEGDLTIFALPARGFSEVLWAALYEGEYTIDTLPEYKPKGYAVELAECQRYYIPGTGDSTWYVANVTKSGYLTVVIPTISEMRIIPTIVPSSDGFGIHTPGAWTKLDETLFSVFKYPSSIMLCVSTSRFTDISLEAGITYLVKNLPALSADL